MKLLLTGGTGTLGKEIIKLSIVDGIAVNILTRNKKISSNNKRIKYFYWDPDNKVINEKCFEGVDVIINLSGFNVFNLWTKRNKIKILNSRVSSTKFILEELNKKRIKIKAFISASAIAAYKSSYSEYYTENESISDRNNFINQVIVKWESAVLNYKEIMPSTSFSIMRIGIVLSTDSGLFKICNKLSRCYLLSTIGPGNQWQSWIHINDVARVILKNSRESWEGIYNVVAPNPVTQKEMLRLIAKYANRKIILPMVPLGIANLIFGEMSEILSSSQKVSPLKLKEKNFRYNFSNLDQALANLNNKLYDNMA